MVTNRNELPHQIRQSNAERLYAVDEDYQRAADAINVSVEAFRALVEVEASGHGFNRDKQVLRRFEPHHFPKNKWTHIGFLPGGSSPWRASLSMTKRAREEAFNNAVNTSVAKAYEATSWGLGQIMGFNAQDAGYNSAYEMVQEFAQGERQQLQAIAILARNWGLDSALRAQDWREVARVWNGPGKINDYAPKLASAYRKHSGKRSPVVLRRNSRGAEVVKVQVALSDLGYYSSSEDGIFGPKTEEAVKSFQADHNLVIDGIVGANTWASLIEKQKSPKVKPSAQEDRIDKLSEKALDVAVNSGPGLGIGVLSNADPIAQYILYGAIATALVIATLAFAVPRIRKEW